MLRRAVPVAEFQSPRGDFGFLKSEQKHYRHGIDTKIVSIPSRGFWFFEVPAAHMLLV